MAKNPNATREQIKKALKKQFMLVYIRDNDWLEFESVLPKPFKDGRKFSVDSKDIDWEQKDKEVNSKIMDAIKEILSEKKPRRITKTYIANKIKYFGLFDYDILERLPISKKTLFDYCETTQQFHERISKYNK